MKTGAFAQSEFKTYIKLKRKCSEISNMNTIADGGFFRFMNIRFKSNSAGVLDCQINLLNMLQNVNQNFYIGRGSKNAGKDYVNI